VQRYSRADLLRILRLTARQLATWEKAGLVAACESYSFFDLLQVKKCVTCARAKCVLHHPAITGSHAEAGGGNGKSPAGSQRLQHREPHCFPS